MGRMACVNLPNLPIQLLLQRQPDWRDQPLAVVDFDKPQGTILYLNDRARALRVRSGMRYAAALSLAGNLRASVVSGKEIDQVIVRVGKRLGRHSPRVEPASGEAGVFWLDAGGIQRLYGSSENWVRCIRSDLQQIQFEATIVLGFKRFATYALAKAQRGVVVLKTPAEEKAATLEVPLDSLSLESNTRDLLLKLGIHTVGQFVELPSTGIAKRFGPQVEQLHKMARRKLELPLAPARYKRRQRRQKVLDYPETDVNRLALIIQQLLAPILQQLTREGRLVSELKIRLEFGRIESHMEVLRPAAPTRDERLLLDLVSLRLQTVNRLPDGVVEVKLTTQSVNAVARQDNILELRPRRDPEAANRALARVRAELGDEAVVRARLRDAHLPEGQFCWEQLQTLAPANPRQVYSGCLIRRIHSRAQELRGWPNLPKTSREDLRPELNPAGVLRSFGPFMVSGGWWRRSVERAYFYAETRPGEIIWIYYDRVRGRWYQQGQVE